jgi:hypothetical protein
MEKKVEEEIKNILKSSKSVIKTKKKSNLSFEKSVQELELLFTKFDIDFFKHDADSSIYYYSNTRHSNHIEFYICIRDCYVHMESNIGKHRYTQYLGIIYDFQSFDYVKIKSIYDQIHTVENMMIDILGMR